MGSATAARRTRSAWTAVSSYATRSTPTAVRAGKPRPSRRSSPTCTAWPRRCHPPWRGAAAVLAFVIIVIWRGISNTLGLNGDYIPAVSVGDTVCLAAGALGPAAVGVSQRVPALRRWLPAVVGGLVGF